MSLTEPDLLDDHSIFQQSSPESLRACAQARTQSLTPLDTMHEHDFDNGDSTSAAETTTTDTDGNDDIDNDENDFLAHALPHSSRSSISSFPASVIHTIQYTDVEDNLPHTPTSSRSRQATPQRHALRSPPPARPEYLSAFRNPSSVRALQLESEYADSSDTLSVRNSPRSYRNRHMRTGSPGSVHSSPTKRGSRPGTPRLNSGQSGHGGSGSKLKKEFPLVLLHCTLLAPAVAARGPSVSDEVLEAVLPEQYRKRWKLLQDKLVKNTEVRQRGVLISHPREEYDVLEERLLESLELERPRIRRGHYLRREGHGSDSGFESEGKEGSEPEVENEVDDEERQTEIGERCSECEKAVSCGIEQERKWEVKVFAANGLMKSGAWAAAWSEMEKVDVEVSVWMPEDVRVEVEERLKALQAKEEAEKPVPVEEILETPKKMRRKRSNTAKLRHDERMREIYGHSTKTKTQEEIDGLDDESRPPQSSDQHVKTSPQQVPDNMQENFSTFAQRHLRLLWHDQKNFAIVLLSALVLLFSLQNAKIEKTAAAPPLSTPLDALSQVLPSPTEVPSLSYITTTVFATPTVTISSDDEARNFGADLLDSIALSDALDSEESRHPKDVDLDSDHPADVSTTYEASLGDTEEKGALGYEDERMLDVGSQDISLGAPDEEPALDRTDTAHEQIPISSDDTTDVASDLALEMQTSKLDAPDEGESSLEKLLPEEAGRGLLNIEDSFEASVMVEEVVG